MIDLRPSSEVSKVYPIMPRDFVMRHKGARKCINYQACADGSIKRENNVCGSWWPHSATCVQIDIERFRGFFRFIEGNKWDTEGGEQILTWSQQIKQRRRSAIQQEDMEFRTSSNMSRFRTSILPLHPLDNTHRIQLRSMGLCLCYHAEIGRVLVTTRGFREGEVVIYSNVPSFDVETDNDVSSLFNPSHPSSCYLLVPRLHKLYYNKYKFNNDDPVSSGDLWYLVNHSSRPNVEVILRKSGIQFKAKRPIHPNEPLLWTYPASFFSKDETPVDLPQFILPDRMISTRE